MEVTIQTLATMEMVETLEQTRAAAAVAAPAPAAPPLAAAATAVMEALVITEALVHRLHLPGSQLHLPRSRVHPVFVCPASTALVSHLGHSCSRLALTNMIKPKQVHGRCVAIALSTTETVRAPKIILSMYQGPKTRH